MDELEDIQWTDESYVPEMLCEACGWDGWMHEEGCYLDPEVDFIDEEVEYMEEFE